MATETNIEKRRDSSIAPVEPTRPGPTYVPVVDIIEKPDELLLAADVPGARAEDIEINYEKGVLSIHAQVEPRQDAERTEYLLNEYGVGDFYRTFQVGEGIDQSKIAAEVKDGMLILHLPKAEALKPRKISVRAG
jgi:HSP20 family protein